jgi:hypothetical protein
MSGRGEHGNQSSERHEVRNKERGTTMSYDQEKQNEINNEEREDAAMMTQEDRKRIMTDSTRATGKNFYRAFQQDDEGSGWLFMGETPNKEEACREVAELYNVDMCLADLSRESWEEVLARLRDRIAQCGFVALALWGNANCVMALSEETKCQIAKIADGLGDLHLRCSLVLMQRVSEKIWVRRPTSIRNPRDFEGHPEIDEGA